MNTPDPCRCPLCSLPNKCGVAAGKGVCWCFSNPIPGEILEKVPAEARGLACVCQSCAFGRTDAATSLARMNELLKRHG